VSFLLSKVVTSRHSCTKDTIISELSSVVKPLLKKLDILIIKAFIGPFIATFFITLFVLVLQFFWLYIDDIVGKGVDMFTVARLIGYVSATLVPLALPLAVLLSSIMTFGNLGETFELIAIKSAGIPLLRFMRPIGIVSLFVCYIAFLFNNNIIPVANLKMNTLKYDIIMSKPAFDIKEGVFYDKIEGYVIKIGKKEHDSIIRNVVIYEQNFAGLQDNIIVADSGKMIVTPDKKSLEFILQDGSTYQEKGERQSLNTEFVRMGFKQYKKILDLSSFKLNKTSDSAFKGNYQMLTMAQLGKNIDSLERMNAGYTKRAATDLKNNLTFSKYLDTTGWAEVEKTPTPPLAKGEQVALLSKFLVQPPKDQPVQATPPPVVKVDSAKKDSVRKDSLKDIAKTDTSKGHLANAMANVQSPSAPVGGLRGKADIQKKDLQKKKTEPQPITFRDLLPDSTKSMVLDRSISVINGAKVNLDQPSYLYENQQNDLRLHLIAWHEKLTLSVACLVMFLIGAPLGSIIRKGGIGMPLVIAVVFFVIFFLLNNFGKKFVKQDVLSPVSGMWMATYVLTPIGLFLIYKALHDSQLFNKEFYFRVAKNIRHLLQRKRIGKSPGSGVPE
jgi:lipopolysaccharide export system permease protein